MNMLSRWPAGLALRQGGKRVVSRAVRDGLDEHRVRCRAENVKMKGKTRLASAGASLGIAVRKRS